MKRNKQEEEYKRLRRLDKRESKLREIGREESREFRVSQRFPMMWVPVEEPQFLGWDVKLVLSETALRRNDIGNLQAIMRYFNMDRYVFTRYEWFVKLIRRSGYKYGNVLQSAFQHADRYKAYYQSLEYMINRDYMPYFEDTTVSENVYAQVPDYLKGYFSRHTHQATAWTPAYYYYKLSTKFPRYELRLKTSRAYSTHRGIPVADAISEMAWIDKQVTHYNYYNAKNGGGSHEAWWHKQTNRVKRKAWNLNLRKLAKHATLDDEVYDLIEQTEKQVMQRGIY